MLPFPKTKMERTAHAHRASNVVFLPTPEQSEENGGKGDYANEDRKRIDGVVPIRSR